MGASFLLFAASLTALVWTARLFTRSAEAIGLAVGLSPFAVGVLIVSLGTSLPELVASLVATAGGTSEIVSGNVLGANVSNLLLVLGAVAVVSRAPLRLGEGYLFIDLHFLVASVLLLSLSMWDGLVGRGEAAFLILAYVLYVTYLLRVGRPVVPPGVPDAPPGAPPATARRVRPADVAIVSASAVGIWLSAHWTIAALEAISTRLGVPPAVIAVTLLSLGTTLPELVVSAVAARQGQPDVAVGNILGSCVFNSLAVVGIAAFVGPVRVPLELVSLPLPVFAGGTLLFYLLTQDKRISGWEGALLLLLYGFFVVKVAGLF